MKVTVHGAAGEVTGSCLLVESGRSRVLVECGLVQGGGDTRARNAAPFPFDPASLDAVVLSHAHIDHSGRLPLLVKAGCTGSIYTHRATRDLARIMLRDSAFLQEKDAEHETRRRQRAGKPAVDPLYTQADAARAVRRMRGLDYGVSTRIAPGITITLHDAGHIIGSAIVELLLEHDGRRRRIVFSGDLGARNAPVMRNPTVLQDADLVLLEGTYGDRLHRPWQSTLDEIAGVFDAASAGRGNILIPAFAVGRTQELLYLFREHYRAWNLDRWQVFLDSPMAIQATEVYARHWSLHEAGDKYGAQPFVLPNLRFTQSLLQSKAINEVRSGAIIIAGSGMCTGGRIRHHLKHNLWRDNCHLMIVGFQARGTLGRQLVDGAGEVTLWGEQIKVAATVHTINGLSAHADQAGLVAWYRNFKGNPPVVLVHGEGAALSSLAAELGPQAKIAGPGQTF